MSHKQEKGDTNADKKVVKIEQIQTKWRRQIFIELKVWCIQERLRHGMNDIFHDS